ncbi:hypothetical protein LCGC14_0829250 [marine sediment metagenome]|uniref:Uncharacterized protein n=1 Tax=marine sediment metagenome TaxID=412755 RepID=A0A0F9PL84_9ZZZZ
MGILLALGILLATGVAGCLPMDEAVQDINTVAAAGKAIIDSPASQLIPPDIRFYSSLAITALMSGTAAYKQWRLTQMGKTTKAIVRGIEATEKPNPGETMKHPVKVAIGKEMRKLGIYDAGNKLVDRLKVS